MATPSTIQAAMREAKADFYGMMTQYADTGLFSGLMRKVGAAEGFFKITDTYPLGSMEDFQGTATVDGLDSATITVNTKLRHHTLGIDHNLLMKGDAISKGEVTRQLQGLAKEVQCDIDQRFTTLLEANTNDIFGSAFFADAKTIPGSSISFDNLRSGAWTDSAAEIKSAIYEGIVALHEMRNSVNCAVHTDPEAKTYVLMYHPAITQFVWDAVNPQLANDTARVDRFVSLVSNPYLADEDDMYMFVADNQYSPFVYGEQEAPNLITTKGDDDALKILHNQLLWQSRYAAEVGYGSAFSAIKLLDA